MLKEKIFASGELIRFFDYLSNSLVLSMKTKVLVILYDFNEIE